MHSQTSRTEPVQGSRARVNVCAGGGTILGWAAFRVKHGDWQPVWKTWTLGRRIKAVGSRVRETAGILRAGDTCGNPTGGTRSRTWHWNGAKFIGTAWKYRPPAPPANPAEFWGADGIGCDIDAGAARCSYFDGNGTGSRFQTATLTPDGSVATCEAALGDPGTCPGAQTPVNAPVLPSGAHDAIGPFDCTVGPDAITCTVAATGTGFVITKQTVTAIDGNG